MIKYITGNLLESEAEALINTVNCVGVMGKGIALQFKQAFPDNFLQYQKACREKNVVPGKMFIVPTGSFFNPKYIINFPTKRHWKGKSRIEDIDDGLNALLIEINKLSIKSIAVPPLGCGNGGLDWNVVRPMMEKAFNKLPDVTYYVYEPKGSPEPDKIKIGTERPKMTKARALLLALMDAYAVPGYKLSMLEIQKLAYFLQVSGEPMRLNFVKHLYGPYADNLNHVLQRLEGHFIRGYGDRSKDAQVYIMHGAIQEATNFLENENESKTRLKNVSDIIFGFETPYGLELLATVHWVMKHETDPQDISSIIEKVHNWNERKKRIFNKDHIKVAWEHLSKINLT